MVLRNSNHKRQFDRASGASPRSSIHATRYASGIGLFGGGSIWNVTVVRQVIEKLPTLRPAPPVLASLAPVLGGLHHHYYRI
jgi:hypothetical protein